MHRGVPPNKLPWGFHLPIWLKMFLLVVNYKHGVMFPPLRHYLNYLRRLKKHSFGNCIQNLKIDMEKNSLFSFTCRIAESMIEITISGWLSIANMVEVLRASSTHRKKRRKSVCIGPLQKITDLRLFLRVGWWCSKAQHYPSKLSWDCIFLFTWDATCHIVLTCLIHSRNTIDPMVAKVPYVRNYLVLVTLKPCW